MPCDDIENEIKMLWRGKVGRNTSSIVSHAPRGKHLVNWWLERTRYVWKRPKAMYLLRSWLRRFLPEDITARLDMEATNFERNERLKIETMESHKNNKNSSSSSSRSTSNSESILSRHRALLMVQEDRRREKSKMRELQSLVRLHCICV